MKSHPFSLLHSSRPAHTSRPVAAATDYLRRNEQRTLLALGSVIKHPRSLARPTASWRPPTLALPALDGVSLTAAVTRYRVGPRAKARLRGFGEAREAAYLITLRFTSAFGEVPEPIAEAWVRGLLPADKADAVHQPGGSAVTFCWFVDGTYRPLHSPASLFEGYSQAA